MASAAASFSEELVCSICIDIFCDPVMLDCGHNFCRACITDFWKGQTCNVSCPECRRIFPKINFKDNRVLSNLAEKMRELNLDSDPTPAVPSAPILPEPDCITNRNCTIHQEKPFELFCETDMKLLCWSCVKEWTHKGHNLLAIPVALQNHKGRLMASLFLLEEKRDMFNQAKCSQEETIRSVESKSVHLIQHIQLKFSKLHQFLTEKEQQLIWEVKEQEERALQPIRENLRKFKEELHLVQQEVEKLQALLDSRDEISFLKDLKGVSDSSEMEYEPPKAMTGTVSLGIYEDFLQFAVWREMRKVADRVPERLTLFGAEAQSELVVSEDKTSVCHLGQQLRGDFTTPEMLWTSLFIRSTERFQSGRHYWEVEVGQKTEWALGVSIYGGERVTSRMSFWTKLKTFVSSLMERKILLVLKRNQQYQIETSSSTVPLSLGVKPTRVGVFLDYEGGKVTFYNTDDMSVIHTASCNFTGDIYAYFNPGVNFSCQNGEPLRICH
ncbi:nuclear factor 7, brain-like isoform X1 [Protopterus annectens]|uniref:nuclear factor 7, brain-like isoform X1 n=1 Tax=Protopterus annectens TaxID=7888 RepID=UPI001CFB9A15|nr:nuclear factor 7, brain-like isoform X1 [Protopterus annectens]